jgi:putative lipase involved disintegration of autophagic bodies
MKNDDEKNRLGMALQILRFLVTTIAILLCFMYMREFRKESVRRFDETFLRLEAMQDLAVERNRALLQRINITDARIVRIDSVYRNLLDEQRKKTIDRVYREEDLEGRVQSGLELIQEEKYGQARDAFLQVVYQEPDNMSARFYAAYSLFYENKLDRSLYGAILKELAIIRANGFDRPEIAEMEAFINAEQNALREGTEAAQ